MFQYHGYQPEMIHEEMWLFATIVAEDQRGVIAGVVIACILLIACSCVVYASRYANLPYEIA